MAIDLNLLKDHNTRQDYINTLTKDELKALINKLKLQDSAFKIILNSYYGSSGQNSFAFFNLDIAASITLQGQDIIKYTDKVIEHYFINEWHLDKELHKKLSIDHLKINPIKITKGPPIIYVDTDSVNENSIIYVKNIGKIKIKDFFKLCYKINSIIKLKNGNEIIGISNFRILNFNNTLYYAKPKKLIRHKVKKKKWLLRSKSGKSIICTEDHSLIVFHDGIQLKIKPSEINTKIDKILTINELDLNFNYQFEDISECKCIGEFEDEWVYDIEMDDATHTFIANDILVHNSGYINYDYIIKSIEGFDTLKISPILFAADIIKYRMNSYLNNKFEEYAKSYNAINTHDFKLEHISNSGIFIAKKNYILDVAFEDRLLPESYLLPKGFDLVKASLPKWARAKGTELIKIILKNGDSLNMDEILNKLLEYKEEFKGLHPDEFSMNFNLRTFKKYVIKDDDQLVFAKGASIYPRSAGYYNHLLYKQTDNIRKKYKKVRTGDKVRFYNCMPDDTYKIDAFSYLPGKFPIEFAPHVDYDEQFNVIILNPLNRALEAMDMPLIEKNVMYFNDLF